MAKALRVLTTVLRLAAAAAAAAAAIIMATSRETTSYFGIQMEAKYQYTPSFVFFVAANAVACAYSVLLIFVPPTSPAWRVVLMTDVILGMVLTGAIAATGAISDVGRNGNSHAGWLPICGQIRAYCNHVMGALISGFVALVLYFLILVYSIHVVTSPLFP